MNAIRFTVRGKKMRVFIQPPDSEPSGYLWLILVDHYQFSLDLSKLDQVLDHPTIPPLTLSAPASHVSSRPRGRERGRGP